MAELFGWEVNKKKKEATKAKSFVAPSDEEGTLDIAGGAGFFGQYMSYDKAARNEFDLIRKYRTTAENPECDQAIEDIINEAITADELEVSVKMNLDWVPLSMSIKKKMVESFDEVLTLLHWKKKGHDIFRRWYVDGRIFYHKLIDESSKRKGITEVRYIDPKFIKKVREVDKTRPSPTSPTLVRQVKEFFIYNEAGVYPVFGTSTGGGAQGEGLKVSPDAIVYVTSGIYNPTTNQVYGHLQKAIKPTNQLRMIEDSVVIYRISRAPERRIFYIDVGNLPKPKAEAYLKDVMTRYRNKLVYDAQTGEVKDDRNQMSMLEDFWLPRREGGRGTEITTLQGGQNLGQMEDVTYFKEKLYRSLNIPVSRLLTDSGFNMGRASEITRDEIKFQKYVTKLRKRFSDLLYSLLRTQLLAKGIIDKGEGNIYQENINFVFQDDGYFSELKKLEIMTSRIEMLDTISSGEMIGRYYSIEWVRKNILMQSEEDMDVLDKQMEAEKKEKQAKNTGGDGDDKAPDLY